MDTPSRNGRDRIRILIVDDHALFRESLARLLAAEEGFEVAAQCASLEEAARVMTASPIDVVLLDADLGSERGADLVPRARAQGFAGRILLVTAGLDGREAARLLAEGVSGIFLKHSPPATLAKSIRRVFEGEAWIDQRYLPTLVGTSVTNPPPEPKGALTRREREVLRGVFDGLANKEISQRLDASESAVKATLQQLFHKTGVRTRSQLVRIALERYRDEL